MATTAAAPPSFAAEAPVAATRRRASVTATLRLMLRAIETRRQLAALDGRMLADIGVSRAEALREANRAPWDLMPTEISCRRSGTRGTGAASAPA